MQARLTAALCSLAESGDTNLAATLASAMLSSPPPALHGPTSPPRTHTPPPVAIAATDAAASPHMSVHLPPQPPSTPPAVSPDNCTAAADRFRASAEAAFSSSDLGEVHAVTQAASEGSEDGCSTHSTPFLPAQKRDATSNSGNGKGRTSAAATAGYAQDVAEASCLQPELQAGADVSQEQGAEAGRFGRYQSSSQSDMENDESPPRLISQGTLGCVPPVTPKVIDSLPSCFPLPGEIESDTLSIPVSCFTNSTGCFHSCLMLT